MNTFIKPSALALIGLITVAPLSLIGFNPQSAPLRYVSIPAAHAQDAAPAEGDKAAEKTPAELADAAYTVLEKNCNACHGAGKRLNKKAATDRASYERLVNEQKKVVAGKPDESEVYTLMIDHDNPMPPKRIEERPSEADIEAVRLWIEKGAPAPVVVEAAAPADK